MTKQEIKNFFMKLGCVDTDFDEQQKGDEFDYYLKDDADSCITVDIDLDLRDRCVMPVVFLFKGDEFIRMYINE